MTIDHSTPQVPTRPDATVGAVFQAHLEEPKGSQGVFELPCGYLDDRGVLHREVHIREITGNEEDMLGSGAVPSYKKISKLVEACVLKLGSLTPAEIASVGDRLLIGDRVFLMFALRRVSLGDAYPFKGACPNSKCGYAGLFTLNLADLEVKPMVDPMKRVYDFRMPSGRVARWRPAIGKDEEELSKARGKEIGRSLAMFLRTLALDNNPPTLAMIRQLGIRDRNAYWDEFERCEGGVTTTMEMCCPICSHEWEEELDVGQAGFFFPSSVQKRSKTNSST